MSSSNLSDLYRTEALSAQSESMGAIQIAQPISTSVAALAAALILAAFITYAVVGEIGRKARVAGVLVPNQGSIAVNSPTTGTISKVFVREGDPVTAGQALIEISAERQGIEGELGTLLAQQLRTREQSLLSERRFRQTQASEKLLTFDQRATGLKNELRQIDAEIQIATLRRALANKTVKKFEALQQEGFVSSAQAQTKQEELLDLDARMAILLRNKAQATSSLEALENEKKLASLASNADLEQLERALASLEQEKLENHARKTSIVVAPSAGLVTGMNIHQGQSAQAGQPLATFIPVESKRPQDVELEVHLYATSRTIGFIESGQQVLLRYQAYPYQKFGLKQGVVVDISRTPFAPSELPPNIATTVISNGQQSVSGFNGSEALYRIKVRPASQVIKVGNVDQKLKPGMTLEADILQERRKIWEWIAEPLLAVAQR